MSAQTSQPPNRDDPGSDNVGRPSLARRFLRAVLLLVRRVCATVLFVLFLLAVYLSIAGFPQGLVQKQVAELRGRGIFIEVAGVRLDLLSGIAAEGFRFYDAPGRKIPMVEADRVILSFNPLDWFKREPGLTGLQIKGAALRINTGGKLEEQKSVRNMTLDRVNARVRVEPGGIRFSRASASILGIDVQSQGFIVQPPRTSGKAMTAEEFSRTLTEVLNNLPAWLPSLFEELNAIRFGEDPRADLNLTLYPTNPTLTEASLHVRGAATQYRGVAFDAWDLDARMDNGILSIPSLTLRYGSEQCSLTASLNMTNGMTDLRVFSSLQLNHWLGLMPSLWCEKLKCEGAPDQGHAMFELWGGPAPFAKVAEKVTGWLSVEGVELHGVWVEKGFVSFRRDGADLTVKKVDAVVGRGPQQGLLRGTVSCRLDTHEFAASGNTGFDPNALLPILTRNQAQAIRSLDFPESPPSTRLEVSGDFDNPTLFQMKGHLLGSNFSYNGASIVSFDSGVSVSNGVLTFSPLIAVRPEGRADGLVAIDFDNEMVEIDATSTCDPYMVGRIIGPNIEKFLRTFRFEGPTRVTAKGRVDYGRSKETDLSASADLERAGISWLLIEKCAFDLHALGTQLDFTNMVGTLYGGAFTGDATFTDIDSGTNVGYRIAGALEEGELSRLVMDMRKVAGDPYEGTVSGQATVSGIFGTGKCGTVIGHGKLHVRDGHLFQVPLLGGLSQLLSRIYPSLGFATQTDFISSFTIEKCRVHTEDAFLEGTVLSARGQGDYFFNERLDMNVQVQFLRGGMVASVVRMVTFPVTKLLEFNLSGTLENPRWRPVNLPKELFLIFD